MQNEQEQMSVQDYLENLNYPLSKDQMLEKAAAENAPSEVTAYITTLPDGMIFKSYADSLNHSVFENGMSHEIGLENTPELTILAGAQDDVESEIPVGYSGTGFDVNNPEELAG